MSQLRSGRSARPGRNLAMYFLAGAAALLFGRATVYGLLFPFVPALVAVLIRPLPLAAALAAFLGFLSLYQTWGPLPVLEAGTSLAAFLIWSYTIGRQSRYTWAAPARLGITSMAAGAVWATVRAQGPEGYWLAVFQGLFAGALSMAYQPAMVRIEGEKAAGVDNPPAAREAPPARFAAVALFASAVAGLDGLTLGVLQPATFLGACLVAAAGLRRGAGTAAAAGALFAAIATLSRGIAAADVGTLALAGFLAGALRGLGGFGSVSGAALGFLAGSYTSAPAHVLGAILVSALAGGSAGALVPASWLAVVAKGAGFDTLGDGPPADGAAGGRRDPGAQKLKALARLFEELSHAFTEAAPAASALGGAAAAPAASGPPSGAHPGGSDVVAKASEHDLAQVVESVASRVCQGCELQRTCWHSEFYRTYRNLGDVWAAAERQGGITPGRLPDDFRRQCIHPGDMAAAVNQVLDLVRLSRYWERRTQEGRDLVAAQLAGVAQIMEGLADAVAGGGVAPCTGQKAPALAYQIGISRANKGGASVSGDTLLHRDLGTSRLVLALSDGMGAGPRAAQESRVAVDLLERLLEVGFFPDVAVRTINSVLLLRSADEVFATLDLLLLNLANGEASFLKTGAAPSFIRRGSQVRVVKSASLPAGILTQIDVPLIRHDVRPGDLLVMVTDGLLSDLGEGQVVEFLRRFPRQEPQLVAEALLGLALEGSQGRAADDITVAAVLVTAAGASPPKPPAGWVPVRWRPIAGGR